MIDYSIFMMSCSISFPIICIKSISIEHTVEKGDLLFKPWFAFNTKEYLTTAVEQPYTEISFLAGFYADWLWANGSMTYAEGFYQTIAQDREIAYEFRVGLKFQFDLKSR